MSLGTLYISIVPVSKADHANEKGFSLIELMIALVIFSVVVALFASARIGQQDQELSQQQAVDMQQTVRSVLLLMAKELRMAGYDPGDDFNVGITGAGNGSPGTTLDLAYVEDFNGIDNDGDGQVDETDELTLKTVSYQLLDRPSANPDGDLDLTVQNNGSGGYQLLAENIPSLDLNYLDADGNVLAAPVALDDIRAVQVAVTAGVDNKELDRFPENNTRTLTTTVNCRNLGIALRKKKVGEYMMLSDFKGFTIIEVLIALAIFSIGILAVAKMQISSVGYNTKSRVYTEAATAGAGQIEDLLNLDFDDPDLELFSVHGEHQRTDVGPNSMYDMYWKVLPAVETSAGDIQVKSIELEVTTDRFPERSFNATYYKAITY